jgi:hypothetical protein
MSGSKKAGVITGDVIKSSALAPAVRKKMLQTIDEFVSKTTVRWPDLIGQKYRGDSIQMILTSNRKFSLRAGLLLQSRMISRQFGIRVAIGLGEISYASKDIVTSDGSAFRASGPYLDELKKRSELISVAGLNDEFTAEWQVHSVSLSYLIQKWSPQQAEAVHLQLSDLTQDEIAGKLRIAQPSVHQRLQLAGWAVLQKILNRFETAGIY